MNVRDLFNDTPMGLGFSLRREEVSEYFKIDGESRVISPPTDFENFGVESDENSQRVWFESPRFVGDDIDLSARNLYVNYKNANGEYDSDFFECVAWRNNAERISKYFHKGDGVGIVGRLQTRTYKDKNGVNRKAIEIIAESIHFPVGSKKSNATASAPAVNGTGASAGATPQYENVDLSDEDLPF
jgi:single-strand DNA-binding protein